MRALHDVQLLRAFVAVARGGNVSRAATQLNLSQSAVSLQLKALADQTGLKLFARRSHGLELTADGNSLLGHAERVLRSLAEFNLAAGGLLETVRGTLRIGTILDPEFIRLGAFLNRLVETTPHAEIELRQSMSGRVLERVRHGELDVGFYLVAPEAQHTDADVMAVRTLTAFEYLVVAPPGWGPLLAGQNWQGLARLPWLATPPQSVHHRLLSHAFGEQRLAGAGPRRVALVDQEASMIDLVKSGVGLSLMRDSIAMRASQAHGVEIADDVRLSCSLAFMCLRQRREEPVIAAAWDALERVWEI